MASKTARTREARTIGPDLDAPQNRPTVDTPGHGTPRHRRLRNHDDPEQRREALHDVYMMAQAGMTEHEIARFIGISRATLYNWSRSDEELAQALRLGKEECNARVERSLYHKAVGYTFESEKVFQHQGEIIRAKVTEHVPPDNTAMIFWLKNRDRENWRDVQEHKVDGKVEVEDKTNRELAMAVLALLRGAMNDGDDAATVIEHLTGDKDGAV